MRTSHESPSLVRWTERQQEKENIYAVLLFMQVYLSESRCKLTYNSLNKQARFINWLINTNPAQLPQE